MAAEHNRERLSIEHFEKEWYSEFFPLTIVAGKGEYRTSSRNTALA